MLRHANKFVLSTLIESPSLNMKKINLITLIVLPMFMTCGLASAAVISGSVSGGVQGGPIESSNSLYDVYEDLSIPTFDSTLGTLVDVELTFSGTTYGEIELSNDDSAGGPKEITAEVTLRFGLWSSNIGNSNTNQSNLLIGLALGSYDSFSNTFNGPTYSVNVPPLQSVTIGDLADGANSDVSETAVNTLNITSSTTGAPYSLNDFIGNGTDTVSMFFSTLSQTVANAPGAAGVAWDYEAISSLDYVYTYENTVVSATAPSSLAIFGGVLVLLGMVKRRRIK